MNHVWLDHFLCSKSRRYFERIIVCTSFFFRYATCCLGRRPPLSSRLCARRDFSQSTCPRASDLSCSTNKCAPISTLRYCTITPTITQLRTLILYMPAMPGFTTTAAAAFFGVGVSSATPPLFATVLSRTFDEHVPIAVRCSDPWHRLLAVDESAVDEGRGSLSTVGYRR